MLRRLFLRDLVIVLVTALAWVADGRLRGQDGGLALIVGSAAGVLAGLVGYLLHEWGHLLASLATGSVVHYPALGQSPLSFHFDSAKNDRRQFFWMSAGGYLASLAGLVLIASLVPWQAWSGRIAIALAGLGALVTFVAEVPITVRVWRGAPLPTGFAYESPVERG